MTSHRLDTIFTEVEIETIGNAVRQQWSRLCVDIGDEPNKDAQQVIREELTRLNELTRSMPFQFVDDIPDRADLRRTLKSALRHYGPVATALNKITLDEARQ